LVYQVKAWDRGLDQIPATRVEWQAAVRPLQVAVADEGLDVARLAEPDVGDRHQRRAGEVLVELRDVDFVRPHAGGVPEMRADTAEAPIRIRIVGQSPQPST